MQTKKIPLRMCSGCGQHLPKKELVRVVRSAQGELSVDLTGRKPGRGAYICPKVDCLKKARQARRLERSLDCQIPDEVYERLEEEISCSE